MGKKGNFGLYFYKNIIMIEDPNSNLSLKFNIDFARNELALRKYKIINEETNMNAFIDIQSQIG